MNIHRHHVQYACEEHPYQNEEVVYVGAGEHQLLTRMGWYTKKTVSKGFIKALKIYIALTEDRAEDFKEDYYGNKKVKRKTNQKVNGGGIKTE